MSYHGDAQVALQRHARNACGLKKGCATVFSAPTRAAVFSSAHARQTSFFC